MSTPTRRRFLRNCTAAAAAASTSGTVLGPRPLRAQGDSPNDRLQVAIIGAGGRGGANTGGVKNQTQIVALCDTNPAVLDGVGAKFPDAARTTDWRELMADDEIDAVVISTADHHHALASLAAMRAGKHVYVEKPLAHTVHEARLVQDEFASHDGALATQMGTQIHATDNYRRAVELVQAGAVGAVSEAHVWCSRSISAIAEEQLPEQPIPEGFNWDVWLGPAEMRPYNKGYWSPGNLNWNRRWEFGNGVLGDMGSHLIDLPYWALELGRPTRVQAEGAECSGPYAPPSQIVTWHHPDAAVGAGARGPVDLTWYCGPGGMRARTEKLQPLVGGDTKIDGWGIGVAFVGSEGVLVSDYGKIVLSPGAKFADYQRPEQSIPKSVGHHLEWVNACRGEGETLCNFDYSGALIEHNLLGNVAHRAALGEDLEWDAEAFAFTNSDAANALLTKPYREGWDPGASPA